MHRHTPYRSLLVSKIAPALRGGALLLAALSLVIWPAAVSAAPKLRKQVDQRGNFVLFGATLAQECEAGAPAPLLGTIGACPNNNMYAPDIYWRADDPSNGTARADANIASADARATAVLVLPADAEITYARLYWGGLQASNTRDMSVQLQRVDPAVDTAVTADDSVSLEQADTPGMFFYQSTADVTELVKMHGPGPYRIAGLASTLAPPGADRGAVAAWYMVVFYAKAGEPSRNLAIFDSLEYVDPNSPVSVTLSGFVVPPAAFDATLGVVAYEGENMLTGDAISFNGTALTTPLNPADNFFNASRTLFGMPVSTMGDLPKLSGAPGSYSNIDMDVIDVKARVQGGQTSATIAATSAMSGIVYDLYVLSAFVTSISTLLPDFTRTTKEVVDVNAGVAAPGDVLEYRIIATNDGSDASVNTVLKDALPMGVTFVPGSLKIESGPNMGTKTDKSGDDQATYDASTRTVSVNLGTGATATMGGEIAIGASTEVRFQVTIDEATRGDLENQGFITAAGKQGAKEAETPTDSDLMVDGPGKTTIFVEECEDDKQCKAPKLHCDVAVMPRQCVVCANSAQCTDPKTPDCDPMTKTCICVKGAGNCVDMDMDGSSDGAEEMIGTDPKDADTDDDGVIDGSEVGPTEDNDMDGAINALDPDSDNDGLPDGLELGLACDHMATNKALLNCKPDADRGATKTSPVDRDTDDGGATDGSEDWNLNGAIDPGETDPTTGHGADDAMVVDTDDDDLGDKLEEEINSNPRDADTDEDGVIDGEEADPTLDRDLDGAISVLDVDSDNDALFDGTELGKNCMGRDTDATKNHCRPDADNGATRTDPTDPDTDNGGVRDGGEDVNLDGALSAGEKNPIKGQGMDDAGTGDADMDGLSDALEDALRTNRNDADSDDDGLSDGEEANPSDDADADGAINALDPDSDADLLFDGTELGKGCSGTGTDGSKMQCRADADSGATKTSPVLPDTDFGGIADGKEDRSHDGARSTDETDPLDPADDAECEIDSDCGAMDSGLICEMGACRPGCRGMDGNSCAEGQRCTSVDGMAGMCVPIVKPHFGGGGCKCGVSIMERDGWPSAAVVLGALLFATRRRRRQR